MNVSDPIYRYPDVLEQAFIGVEGSIIGFNFIVLIYIIVNRDWLPLKAKQIPLVATMVLAGAFWWVGGLAETRILPQVGNTVFLICSLWSIWVQLVLGVFLFVHCLFFRYFKLFIIVILKVTTWTPRRNLIWFWILYLPVIAMGIALTVVDIDGPTTLDGVLVCAFKSEGSYAVVAFLGLIMLIFFALAFILRSPKQAYLREYRETSLSIFVFILAFIIFATLNKFAEFEEWSRIVTSVIYCGIPTFTFYVIIGQQAWNCLFNRDKYEEEFKFKLQDFSDKDVPKNGKKDSSS